MRSVAASKASPQTRRVARSSTPLVTSIGPHRDAARERSLMPLVPSAIPILAPHGPLEREADAMAGASSTHSGASSAGMAQAPPIVHDAFASPGRPLESSARAVMESRLGVGLAGVRIHTGGRAAEAARAVSARAFTVGQDIFFGANLYDPHSREGQRLLAHELTHTVQQSSGANGLSGAGPSLQRDPIPGSAAKPVPPSAAPADADPKKAPSNHVTVFIPPTLLPHLQLTPPSAISTPPGGSATSAAQPGPLIPAPSSYIPPAAGGAGVTPSLAPSAPAPTTAPTTGTKAPDRLSFHDFGNFSIGGRIGFPDLTPETKPGEPPSAAQEALKRAEMLNFIVNGVPPSEYQVDPAKMVGAIWGIFSTQIDPDLAKKIAASMASKPKTTGPTYQLDATILFGSGPGGKTGGGAGAIFTVNF
jgi:uncharacterized protein DUF4157